MRNALIAQRSHDAITTYLLCREFGWTPSDLRQQDAKDVEQMIFILNEVQNLKKSIPSGDDSTKTILITED